MAKAPSMVPSYCFLLLSLLMILKISYGSEENVDVIYPVRLHMHRSKRDLSTALNDDKKHEDSLSIKIKSKFHDDDIILDLQRDEGNHPDLLLLRTYDEEGNPQHDQHKPENCYYTGSVRDMEDSYVRVSTCNDALLGIVEDGSHVFDIEPIGDDGAHRFAKADDILKDIAAHKASKDTLDHVDEDEDLKVYTPDHVDEKEETTVYKAGEMITDVRPIAKSVRPYGLINVEPQYYPYMTTNDTRWVEVFVSVDYSMYKWYKNVDRALERVLNTIGSVDKAYQAINVRLVVVAVEIQNNGDSFPRYTKGYPDLKAFGKHYWGTLKKVEPFKSLSIDTGMLLSYQGWTNCGGMAHLGKICTEGSPLSVSQWYPSSIAGSTTTIGHEFGHTMNFKDVTSWEGQGCKCLTKRGCFMGGFKTVRPGFETCGLKRFKAKSYHCLNNHPKNPLSSECGNGIIEKGEECDCGNPEMCKRTDPCCQPYGCKLKVEAQCSYLDECCSNKCLFKKHGTVCRKSTSQCDAAEYCTGESSTCPVDEFLMDGNPCGKGTSKNSYCYSGDCINTLNEQCQKLWNTHKRSCKFKVGRPKNRGWYIFSNKPGGQSCIDRCLKLKNEKNNKINGVAERSGGRKGCYCLTKMRGRNKYSKGFNSCMFGPLFDDATASEHCWQLNRKKDGYGTCSAATYKPCKEEDIKCGQLQCSASKKVPKANVDFGKGYKVVDVKGSKCSSIKLDMDHSGKLKHDEIGVGMVADGSKCGDGKMCIAQKCISVKQHHIKNCPSSASGAICNGNGLCSYKGTCICNFGYDSKTNCLNKMSPVNGGWSDWANWSQCTKECGSGTRRRHRFCDKPSPKYGGLDCHGNDRLQVEACNTDVCIVGKTCKDIKVKTEAKGRKVHDGIYLIKPTESVTLHVYCDMTRDGGGWTLLVSSHTNSWTNENVKLRNVKQPHLYKDYSILQYANQLKNSYLIDSVFQYRLEAHNFGVWGGIWKAPNSYDLASTNSKQKDVTLLKRFSDWKYKKYGLGKRLPYIDGPRITTSAKGVKYGCVTDNQYKYHPSRWIYGRLMMTYPEHVWYWFREGNYPITNEPSTTKPSTTQQPTTQPPTTKAPTTKAPTTKQPTTKPPTTKQPTTKQPTTKQPTTKPPTTKQPTTKPPTTKQPTTKQPTTKQPTTKQPTTKPPTTKQPTTRQPTTKPSTTKQPTTKPPTTKPATTKYKQCQSCQTCQSTGTCQLPSTKIWGRTIAGWGNIDCWQHCSMLCEANTACKAFTYYDEISDNPRMCYLRGSVSEVEGNYDGCTSGYRGCVVNVMQTTKPVRYG